MDIFQAVPAALTAVARLVDMVESKVLGHFKNTSLTQLTRLTQVEPLTIISQDCMNSPDIPKIMNAMCTMFSSYYLQAINVLTRINNVEVVRTLDALNPNRDSSALLLQSRLTPAAESIDYAYAGTYRHRLPVYSAEAIARPKPTSGLEATIPDNSKVLAEQANLAVGKLLNVSILTNDPETKEAKNFVIPVNVRLLPSFVSEETLSYIFTHKKDAGDFIERYYSWRSGRIEGIRDLVFCQDLIIEYRRAAMKDKSGVLKEIVRRVTNNRTFGLLSKNPSLAMASNLYIISSETAKMMEGKTGLRFDNSSSREKLLEGTYAMIIAVYNSDWEQVTFYFNGISQGATFPMHALKADKAPDIGDMMKTLMEGRAPSF